VGGACVEPIREGNIIILETHDGHINSDLPIPTCKGRLVRIETPIGSGGRMGRRCRRDLRRVFSVIAKASGPGGVLPELCRQHPRLAGVLQGFYIPNVKIPKYKYPTLSECILLIHRKLNRLQRNHSRVVYILELHATTYHLL
jgi:hypothetical protein